MSLRQGARIARRELRGGLRGFRIFLACLALGVAAIAAVGSVRAAIEAGLAAEGATLLGGDAEMQFTYRFATPEERAWMDARADAVSEIADFRSMANVARGTETERALTQLKAVDDAYPLKGEVVLDPPVPLAEALDGTNGLPGVVMALNLVDRLALEPGDVVRFGTQDFAFMATLVNEPDDAGGGFGLGPRSIVRRTALDASGLLEPGTLFDTHYRLALPSGSDLDALKAAADDRFGSTGGRWRDARNGAPGVAAFVDRLGAFLVLVGLSGLAVGGVGVSAAVSAYLSTKTSVIATLRTLGAGRGTIFWAYALQIAVLSAIGITIGLLLGGGAPVVLAPLIASQLPVPAVFAVYWGPLGEAALYGTFAAAIFTLWPLARAEEVRAATLFRDALDRARLLPRPAYLVAIFVAVAALVGSAAWFSGTATLTLWTFGGILGALVILGLAAVVLRWSARRLSRRSRGRPPLRWALASIGGPLNATGSVVLSLGLGLSVLAAVGQIDGNLRQAIQGELPDVAPSYFFVDIQKDQMPGYLGRLEDNPGVTRVDSAPMLRGIITRINDRPAVEVAGDHWVLSGDRGVTYSTELPDNTRLTEGTWWDADYTGPPLISFAAEEAEEMGLKIGDTLTINILGRDITGTISSFREVDFSTAGIGFILSMNPSALAGAPHSFISTVYADAEAEGPILRDLARAYPNITAIRVRDAIDQVSVLLSGIASATSWGAAATLLTGFLVLIGASAAGLGARIYEAAILKTLGATRRRILASFALRAVLLGLGAGLVALAAGILGGWAVSRFVMETGYTVIWPSALAIVAGGVVATTLTGLLFARAPVEARPARVLRGRD
ncbi:ABC transporter permease [Pseudaestuariivita atlantica]|uniref:Drug:proton antiporter n=1 Tax=Pseudaestuariivita atlantica TaxID=1317121 RepID=A0A0L1JS22_9RHOB|nr:FtsX-like permease family protein [Pseudaestuariivita atlantica]KNG94208.1 drug:proton antiporter [Pseudaestuariivita atlantica]